MSTIFPFGFDTPTVFYLSLYLLTLVVHVFFMSYVLAGSLYLTWANLFPGTGDIPRVQQPLACLLRDWMPFVLSAAITAGVAPLLFVQIIYDPHFYTANLLLGWRWMVVIPVLTAAFYLLYVIKSRTVAHWPIGWRAALGMGTAACFLFIAFCWSANHLLSIHRSHWPEAYASSHFVTSRWDLALRLITWIAGTFPVMSVLAGWQLAFRRESSATDAEQCDTEARRLAKLSICGLMTGGLVGCVYCVRQPEAVTGNLVGSAGATWIAVTVIGVLLQVAAWVIQWRNRCFCKRSILMVTAGAVAMLISTAVLREIIRVTEVGLETFDRDLLTAFEIDGFTIFLLFAVLNSALIIYCVRLIQCRRRTDS